MYLYDVSVGMAAAATCTRRYNGSYLLLVGSDVSTPLSEESRRRVPKEQQSPCLVQTDARPAVDVPAMDVSVGPVGVGVPCTVYRVPCGCGCGLNRVCWFVTSQIWECCFCSAVCSALLCFVSAVAHAVLLVIAAIQSIRCHYPQSIHTCSQHHARSDISSRDAHDH